MPCPMRWCMSCSLSACACARRACGGRGVGGRGEAAAAVNSLGAVLMTTVVDDSNTAWPCAGPVAAAATAAADACSGGVMGCGGACTGSDSTAPSVPHMGCALGMGGGVVHGKGGGCLQLHARHAADSARDACRHGGNQSLCVWGYSSWMSEQCMQGEWADSKQNNLLV